MLILSFEFRLFCYLSILLMLFSNVDLSKQYSSFGIDAYLLYYSFEDLQLRSQISSSILLFLSFASLINLVILFHLIHLYFIFILLSLLLVHEMYYLLSHFIKQQYSIVLGDQIGLEILILIDYCNDFLIGQHIVGSRWYHFERMDVYLLADLKDGSI